MDNKVKAIGIGGIVVMIVLLSLMISLFSDKEGPEIQINESVEIVYHEGEDKSVLLKGVTANDLRDGDVSKSVIVDSVIIDGNIIKVRYAVKDSKNNITVSDKYREIKYVPLMKDENEVNTEGEDDNNSDMENDSNSENDDNEVIPNEIIIEEINKEIADKSGIPVITLIKREVSINEGESFSDIEALEYVKETYDNSGDVSRRIRVTGNEGELVEGDYEIKYTVSDTDGNVSEPAILILHVLK